MSIIRISNAKIGQKYKAWYISTLQNGENPTSVAVTTLIFSINFPRLIKVIYTFSVKRQQQFFPLIHSRGNFIYYDTFLYLSTHTWSEWEIIYAFLREKKSLNFISSRCLGRKAGHHFNNKEVVRCLHAVLQLIKASSGGGRRICDNKI